MHEGKGMTVDRSNQYKALMLQQQAVLSDGDQHALRSHYQFLFIKGFLGDLLPQRLDNYFSDQIAFLKCNAIDHLRLESDSGFGTQKRPENNVAPIEKALTQLSEQQSGKRVIIVSHSKGGLDTLEMLVSGKSHDKQKVAGWISLQAPFAGTPLADWATDNKISSRIVGKLLGNVFRGDQTTTNAMRTDIRQKYLNEHSGAISALASSIRILNFTSHIEKTDPSIFILRRNRNRIQRRTKQPNDGVLPQESGLLKVKGNPCCPFIRAEHVDHLYPVLRLKPEHEPTIESGRERLFQVLLKLWLDNKPG